VSVCHRYWPEEGSDLYHIYEVRPQFTLCSTVYRLVRSVNVKYFVSHKAHRAAFLSINQIIQYWLQPLRVHCETSDHGYGRG